DISTERLRPPVQLLDYSESQRKQWVQAVSLWPPGGMECSRTHVQTHRVEIRTRAAIMPAFAHQKNTLGSRVWIYRDYHSNSGRCYSDIARADERLGSL